MSSMSPHRSARDVDIEQDYAEHRGAVLAMLRAEFPRLRDAEELYQEAWAELLDRLHRGRDNVIDLGGGRGNKRQPPSSCQLHTPAWWVEGGDEAMCREQLVERAAELASRKASFVGHGRDHEASYLERVSQAEPFDEGGGSEQRPGHKSTIGGFLTA